MRGDRAFDSELQMLGDGAVYQGVEVSADSKPWRLEVSDATTVESM